jgi:RNA polymerase sigma factor (sigma-70 family)
VSYPGDREAKGVHHVDNNALASVRISDRARELFTSNYAFIAKVARSLARPYGSHAEDLIQEGFIALLRGFDGEFDPGRQEWMGYVKVVLRRAMARSAEQLAKDVPLATQDRDPDGASWAADETMKPDRRLNDREVARDRLRRRYARLNSLRARLTASERTVMELRLNPPPELVVMARNTCGDDFMRRGAAANEITAEDIANYTGTSRAEVRRLIRTARMKCAELRAS